MSRMRFGAFIPPHHLPTHYNPTYALQRDVEIVQLLDTIGYDEAWFGEQHSGGAARGARSAGGRAIAGYCRVPRAARSPKREKDRE